MAGVNLAILAQPAFVMCGDIALTTPQRMWLDWLCERVSAALGRTIGRSVEIGVGSQKARTKSGAAFALALQTRGGEVCIELDAEVARALCDAMAMQFVGLRGDGAPSAEDLGVLEFLAIDTLDQVLAEADGAISVALSRIGAHEIRSEDSDEHEVTIQLGVQVGGRAGYVFVRFPRAAIPVPTRLPPRLGPECTPAGDPNVTLCVELPPLHVASAEFHRLCAGDLLLTGARDLAAYAASVRLTSTTRWTIGVAAATAVSATGMTVRIGALQPTVDLIEEARDCVAVVPRTGSRSVPVSVLSEWQRGIEVSFPFALDQPIVLATPRGEIAIGEWVKFEDELAVRILRMQAQ